MIIKSKFVVIPEPESFEIYEREIAFGLNEDVIFEGTEETQRSLDNLLSFLGEVFFFQPLGMGRQKIRLEISGEGESEGYTLKVEKDRILLVGNDEKGLFYAVQTLKQLLFCGEGKLPCMLIKDKPRFGVRGFMLDCGRYFFTVDAVKQFIDMMALHKLNEFHWHLSEDQGFRCELESKPLLTLVGSSRSHTNFNNKPHEGFYTKAELKEIIDYAHDRYMKVIPEIDTPGHVMSMLCAYPELACFPRDFSVSTFWGVKHDVLCPGKESTFDFMKEIYDELTEIFTDGVIHLGGDEVPTVRWKDCPDCQKRMKEEGFTDEGQLHTYYLDRIASYLQSKGLEVRMWNDTIKDKMVDKSVTWQLWNGGLDEKEAVRELNNGRRFVISCSRRYYLDLPYAHISLKSCYEFDPCFEGLTEEGVKNVIGVEGCLWTEFVPNMVVADRMTYPRIAAISESAWSQKNKKDFSRFEKKMPAYYSLMKKLGIGIAPLKKTSTKGIKTLAGKLYWERRQLCWGAHQNILSDLQVKKICKSHSDK